jgi:hypothetical protein
MRQAKYGSLEPGARLGPRPVTVTASGTLTLKTKSDSIVVLRPVDSNSIVRTICLNGWQANGHRDRCPRVANPMMPRPAKMSA